MTLILKKYNYEPYEILKYIEKQGTKVFYLEMRDLSTLQKEAKHFTYHLL